MKSSIVILNLSLLVSMLNIELIDGMSVMEKWRMYGIKAKLHVIDEKMLEKLKEFNRIAEKLENELKKQQLMKEKLELEQKKKQEELRHQIYIKYLVRPHNSSSIFNDMITRMFW